MAGLIPKRVLVLSCFVYFVVCPCLALSPVLVSQSVSQPVSQAHVRVCGRNPWFGRRDMAS